MTSQTATPEDMGAAGATLVRPSLASALPHYLPLCAFPLIIAAAYYGGWWLAAPLIFFSLAWPLDQVFGLDGRNMDPAKTPERRLLWHNLPVWGWAFLWPPTLIFGLWQILIADVHVFWEDILLAIILTMEGQAVFVVGHEMVHRRSTWQRRLGEFLLSSASYPQYATEHVYVHHAQVGTPHDAGSAPKGESFWRYFPKEIVSNLTNSWQVAREHLGRRHLPVWHFHNPFWRYGLALAFWYGLVLWMSGGSIFALLVFVFLGLSCVFSMKITNYFQHYGLRRVRMPNGRWERVMPRHSWNADWKFSNWMFFNMQRHADHHAMATRQYPLLQVHGPNQSPQVPHTYGEMMNLVLRPKKWFAKMDPLVDQWRKHFYPEIDDWSAYDSPVTAARPDALDAIIEIYAAAPRLARWIEQTPAQLDTLKDREFTDIDLPAGFGPDPASEAIARRGLARLYWTREIGIDEMRAEIAEIPAADARETADIVRIWSNGKAFQIGMHVIRGNLSAAEARVALSNLAEASIVTLLSAVVADFVEQRGALTGGLAAVGLGKLASREVYPGMAPELLLVQDGLNASDSKRLARNFHECLKGLTSESLLFSPLEPNTEACAMLPLSELTPSEAPDLTRARILFEAGESDISAGLARLRRELLAKLAATHALDEPVQQPKGAAISISENMRAGLADIERMARATQMSTDATDANNANAESEGGEQVPSSAALLAAHASLGAAATLLRDLQGAYHLVGDVGFELDHAGTKVKSVIATACGHEDFAELESAVAEAASSARKEMESLLAAD